MRTRVIYTPERRNRLFERFRRRFGAASAPRTFKPGYALWRAARNPTRVAVSDGVGGRHGDGGLTPA